MNHPISELRAWYKDLLLELRVIENGHQGITKCCHCGKPKSEHLSDGSNRCISFAITRTYEPVDGGSQDLMSDTLQLLDDLFYKWGWNLR